MSESKTKDAGLPGGNRDKKNAKARRYMRKGSGPPHFDTLHSRFLPELPMIGFREDGFEPLRYKLRMLSDHELIQFGRELRKKCFKPKEDCCWKELQLAREEWRSRHPKPVGSRCWPYNHFRGFRAEANSAAPQKTRTLDNRKIAERRRPSVFQPPAQPASPVLHQNSKTYVGPQSTSFRAATQFGQPAVCPFLSRRKTELLI